MIVLMKRLAAPSMQYPRRIYKFETNSINNSIFILCPQWSAENKEMSEESFCHQVAVLFRGIFFNS
jgi:hypothetical protein